MRRIISNVRPYRPDNYGIRSGSLIYHSPTELVYTVRFLRLKGRRKESQCRCSKPPGTGASITGTWPMSFQAATASGLLERCCWRSTRFCSASCFALLGRNAIMTRHMHSRCEGLGVSTVPCPPLEHLQTDSIIDILMVHCEDHCIPYEEIIQALNDLGRCGIMR